MIRLIDILKENNNMTYDFGGSFPWEIGNPNWIIVDIISKEEYLKQFRSEIGDEDTPNPFIQADLSKPTKLTPVKNIFSRGILSYISPDKLNVYANNINNNLLSGGKYTIMEDYDNAYENLKSLIDILLTLGFTIIESNLNDINLNDEDGFMDAKVILKK